MTERAQAHGALWGELLWKALFSSLSFESSLFKAVPSKLSRQSCPSKLSVKAESCLFKAVQSKLLVFEGFGFEGFRLAGLGFEKLDDSTGTRYWYVVPNNCHLKKRLVPSLG